MPRCREKEESCLIGKTQSRGLGNDGSWDDVSKETWMRGTINGESQMVS